jgi:hypothetical protein
MAKDRQHRLQTSRIPSSSAGFSFKPPVFWTFTPPSTNWTVKRFRRERQASHGQIFFGLGELEGYAQHVFSIRSPKRQPEFWLASKLEHLCMTDCCRRLFASRIGACQIGENT